MAKKPTSPDLTKDGPLPVPASTAPRVDMSLPPDAVIIKRRPLTNYQVSGNEPTTVLAYGERGSGNANHNYIVQVNGQDHTHISFTQLLGEVRMDAVTDEVLLAILIDRLQSFQSGNFPHNCNALALESLLHAQEQFKTRTRERIRRGVEWTLTK